MVVDDIFYQVNAVFVIECYKVGCVTFVFVTTVPGSVFIILGFLLFKVGYSADKMYNFVFVFNSTFHETKISFFEKYINKLI